ncbi:hypothetical protein [Streptomonospora wellingtoniae]|uniref:Integral membrane protein n=1 Tax=Streptomonospora wellingtoniae TaxID=3075544 RepID=A0ABU2KXC6_9ACTN|nr:hypothetical protein [Streptomonospora sp. DSM 45055]MDT0303900.1 hypothetical protein [Streptomonospora sp. DSM 45055]
MVTGAILAVEALFWVFVAGGLAARYLARAERLSTVLLLLVPVLDAVLLAVIAVHLSLGGTADRSHGFGALYLGFTVAYGHSLIRWADVRFAHRFAGGLPPQRPPKAGAAAMRREAAAWLRCAAACAIGAGVLAALILFVGDAERTAALRDSFGVVRVVLTGHTLISVWIIAEAATRSRREDGGNPGAADDRRAGIRR